MFYETSPPQRSTYKTPRTVLSLAILSAFVLPSISRAADYEIKEFPDLSTWTISSSITQGFSGRKLSIDSSGWDPVFKPISSNENFEEDTVLYADKSGNFKQYQSYFIFSDNGNDFTVNLNGTTLRLLDESRNPPNSMYELATLINVDGQSSINFIGDENSAVQMQGQGSRAIFVDSGNLTMQTGSVWVQLKNDRVRDSSIVQIQKNSSLDIDVANDIVFLADLSESGGIQYGILNNGLLKIDANRIFVGFENAGSSLSLIQANGIVSMGSDRTELIALNGGRAGLEITANLDQFTLQTDNLQIIGDDHADSKAIWFTGEAHDKMSFVVGDAYLGDVATGISLAAGKGYLTTGKLQFNNLLDIASSYAIDLDFGELELTVKEQAYFDKVVRANSGYLTLHGGHFVFNDSVTLDNRSLMTGSLQSMSAQQISAKNSSLVDLEGQLSIGTMDNLVDYALSSTSQSEININAKEGTDAITQVQGNIFVSDQGKINMGFSSENSYFIGTVITDDFSKSPDSGLVSFSLGNGAFWRVTASNTTSVNLALNESTVYLDQSEDGQSIALSDNNAKTLNLSSLTGDGGIFYMRTSLQEAYGDSIYVGTGEGKHQLMISSSGHEPSEVALNRALVTEMQGSLELSLANDGGKVDLGNYVYDLVSRKTDAGTEWYLKDLSAVPEEPDSEESELSPSATAVLALAGSGSQTTQFLYSLSDLRKRMGDIRHGVSDGLYASVRGGKDKISGFAKTNYKNEYGALSVGFDRKVSDNWITGLSFETIKGDQKVKSNGYRADGEDSTQSVRAYATWFNETGYYVDFVTSINHFDQKIRTHMLDGTPVKGDYNSYSYGVSTEIGKTIYWEADNSYFIEPQVQLSYFRVQGDDFSMSNDMRIEQENADSLTGRLGLVLGRTVLNTDGTGYQVAFTGGVNHEFLGDANIRVNGETFTDESLGTRGYYGVRFNWYVNQSVRLYGLVEREQGARYTSEINAQMALKYHF